MESRRPDAYGVGGPSVAQGEGGNFMWSNIKTLLAAALIIAGIATFAYQGITFATRGRTGIPLPVIAGAISLVAGIALFLMDTQDFKRAVTPKRAQNGELQ